MLLCGKLGDRFTLQNMDRLDRQKVRKWCKMQTVMLGWACIISVDATRPADYTWPGYPTEFCNLVTFFDLHIEIQ